MLRATHELKDYSIGATDGAVGHVKDFYVDDDAWVIRYLVVETGSWLSSRPVLISRLGCIRTCDVPPRTARQRPLKSASTSTPPWRG